ncbi:uncharacterized protein LOC128386272 [Panonychus citri]|uniref:uncharacterized protein LOC128386272 n=1 Tax=Panonychus citri TaxID=50023 RepID=UPI002307D922|nr:uncharacterized protein LOC128386272 [Panonychus citri]
MLLNDLPDVCLWMIFANIYELEELIQLSKVCSKWANLISERFKRVKYLVNYIGDLDVATICMNYPIETLKHHNLRELLPNLRIVSVYNDFYLDELKVSKFRKVFNNNPKIKGVIGINKLRKLDLRNIEMIAMDNMVNYLELFRPDQLKQSKFEDFDLAYLAEYAEYFPNLKRLHISGFIEKQIFNNIGSKLSNLKILEYFPIGSDEKLDEFHLIDFCPALESAFIRGASDGQYIDASIKNYMLRDLVIEIPWVEIDLMAWSSMRILLSKFPNLHNLAIRGSGEKFEDNHIKELVELLPEIKLLDFRESKKFTENSADFLSEYCRESNRPVKIYYDCENEPSEWPKLSTAGDSVVYGFDFMKHHFYKHFRTLPDLIDE